MANLLKINRKNKHLPIEEKRALLITEMRSTLSAYERQIFDMLINRPVGVLEISFALCINDPRGHISVMGRKKGIPIQRRWVYSPNGKRYKEYWIELN